MTHIRNVANGRFKCKWQLARDHRVPYVHIKACCEKIHRVAKSRATACTQLRTQLDSAYDEAFKAVKKELANACPLHFPTSTGNFIIMYDAFDIAVVAALA